jgi:hypothetical protein
VQRVHLTGLDGAAGGNERLPRDLPAEDALPFFFGTDAAKDVDLELFEVEQIDQIVSAFAMRLRVSKPWRED